MGTVTVEQVTLVRTTDAAALFLVDADDREVWLPLSQIDITAWDNGDCDDLEMPKWLADAKELDYDED